jgi:hypothetical protein
MWARIALDMSFYTIIPLVLLSIISGDLTPLPAPPQCAEAALSLHPRSGPRVRTCARARFLGCVRGVSRLP